MRKNYNLIAHALHSRLQLIRSQILITPHMSPSDVVAFNQKLFDRAGASVEQYHNHKCNKLNYYEAAELFIAAWMANGQDNEKMPMWTVNKSKFYMVEAVDPDGQWHRVSTETLPDGSPGAVQPLTYEQANKYHQKLIKMKGGRKYFRVAEYRKE
jgi:hypothetical protein